MSGATPRPLVSIVTPTRNRPDWLSRALVSFKSQSYDAFESIVVDDGSSEDTWNAYAGIWRSLDRRFILETLTERDQPGRGPAAARNRGVQRSKGDFIAFCDDDDRWRLRDHLDVAVRAMEATGADFFLTNLIAESGDRELPAEWVDSAPALAIGSPVFETPAVYELPTRHLLSVLRHYVPHPDGWVIRRTLFEEVGGFWERISYAEDWELLLRLAAKARRILYRPDPVIAFNVTPRASLFASGWSMKFEAPIQAVAAAFHVCGIVENREVRQCARSLAAWHFRRMSRDLVAEHRPDAAVGMAWQAVCTYPTPGACRELATAFARALGQRVSGRPSA